MEIKEEEKRLVVLTEDGKEAGEMTWTNAGEIMIIDHTFVEDAYRGLSLAEKLVHQGVDIARRDHKQVIPLCPFAKKEFSEKPEYQDVLKK